MNPRHPSPSDLGLYVTGALDALRTAELEQHVSVCSTCARALAQEARLEMAFEQIAARVVESSHARMRAPARRRPLSIPAAGSSVLAAIAFAAAVLLGVGRMAMVDKHSAVRPSFDSRTLAAQPVRGRAAQDAAGSTVSLDAMASLDELDGG